MPINDTYNEEAVVQAIATALDEFYTALINKVDKLNIKTVIKRKNPYLFRAKAMNGAAQIVDAILAAFVSSSEETIFGNVFFEPIATAAVQGQKALAEGVDIMVERENTIYAIAVKSGTSVFNADSRKKQEQNFMAASKLAQQAKKRFVPIIGYGYGKKKASKRGLPKFYEELAGKDFWTELTGDEDFYIKLIRYMADLPEKYVANFDESYQKAANRLVKEFTNEFCNEDGSIDWEKLVEFNSGSK
ncbi:PmeII family type II restriction endonuclease [Lacrimispora sp. AGF001]|uniref:PmeII family type II restriction endonuclease n=1 Tax=Lacrimispora sp. AGF001 TaxID=3401631 RepID=UPI003B430E7A